MISQVTHMKAGAICYDKYGSRWRTKGISWLSTCFKAFILQVFILEKPKPFVILGLEFSIIL